VWSPSQAIVGRAAKRNSALYTSINLAALASVLVTLLALFLVLAAPHTHDGVPVDFPSAQNSTRQPHALREDAMRVVVTRDGRIYFGNHAANPQELPELIRTALREGSEKTIYLVADRRAKYADVKVALDQIRLAGIGNVVVLTGNPTGPVVPR
jgi:biopolymer transport protein ExbD